MIVRVSVLLDQPQVAAWEAAMLKKVAESRSTELRVLLLARQEGDHRANPLIRLYEKLDAKMFRYKPDALRRVDVRTVLPDVQLIQIDQDNRGESDVQQVSAYKIDVLINLARRGR